MWCIFPVTDAIALTCRSPLCLRLTEHTLWIKEQDNAWYRGVGRNRSAPSVRLKSYQTRVFEKT